MRIKKEDIIILLIFVVPLAIVLSVVLLSDSPPNLPEFTILNGEYLFEINSNGVPVLENNRLKVIIDGKHYWIKLEDEINHRFFKDTSTEMRKMP